MFHRPCTDACKFHMKIVKLLNLIIRPQWIAKMGNRSGSSDKALKNLTRARVYTSYDLLERMKQMEACFRLPMFEKYRNIILRDTKVV